MPKNIVLAKSVELLYKRWQKEADENTGYAVAHETPESLACLVSFKTDEGNTEKVEGNLAFLIDLVYDFLRNHPDAKVLPVHSHPIEGISTQDAETLKAFARFNLNYTLVVTPTTINGYYTTIDGVINKVAVAVIEDSKFSEEIQRKGLEYAGDLANTKRKNVPEKAGVINSVKKFLYGLLKK